MRILQNLRYLYYCEDRKWRRYGVRGFAGTNYLILAMIILWAANLAMLWICVRGGPGRALPVGLTRRHFGWIGGAFGGIAAVLWTIRGRRIVDQMYRDFEPDGVPLPVDRKRILIAVLTPLLIFLVLAAIVGVWQYRRFGCLDLPC